MIVRTYKHKDEGEGSFLRDQHTLRSNKTTSNERSITNKGKEPWLEKCYALEFMVSKLLGYNSSYDVIDGDFRIGTQLRRKLHGS